MRALPSIDRPRRAAFVMVDLIVAISLLLIAILPIAFAFHHERTLARGYYHRVIANEILDGEFETLMAGEWKAYPEGRQAYTVDHLAATNLPAGEFLLTRRGTTIRLEWRQDGKRTGLVREGTL